MEETPLSALCANLSTGETRRERLPEDWGDRFVGGKGLAARYLYETLEPGTDPLSDANVVVFAIGPLSGHLPGETRVAAVTKSPLSGAFLDSYVGGSFASRLVGSLRPNTLLVVEGVASAPSALVVSDGDARIERTASWGEDAVSTDAAFDGGVACIGPAGENRVRFATVAVDGGDHQFGRGGVGAVFGSKRLKAVVARDDPPTRGEGGAGLADAFESSDAGRWLDAHGTVGTVEFADAADVLPTRGWRDGTFAGAEDIGIEAVRAAATARERSDDDVPGDFRVRGDDGSVPRGATPISLGAALGIDDFDAVAELGGLCDRLGLDVISAGNAVAWAARAAEEGLLSDVSAGETHAPTFGGVEEAHRVSFVDPDTARELLEHVVRRDTELGDTLADGVAAAVSRFGGADLIPIIKGLSLPTYDPRGSPAQALAYATSDRGACHRRARPVVEEVFATEEWTEAERAASVVAEQNARAASWCLVADDFVGEALADRTASMLEARGYDQNAETLGERVWNLTRLFNVREGFDREDDSLPAAIRRSQERGHREGLDADAFDSLLSAYYDRRGWDERGRPTRSTLERLDLLSDVDAETPVGE
ncbi:aldehyde:ferredoxin oxidoreductase [Halopelagius inordinatus]|uniref:Aldehyde:ferredoxin oxidoreductase n=1 Tax=Halopelagius inordinatus TaxID=553467 RepID=A0A1I2ME69_9EURY|nr:aldehyde ferredoxin oxidoreductase C-terminal domain-containing protein [Halopelagius inordinatus]SFF89228.1 aldehyde:ferredoxin oxidoreductase [Halopelagius inordinatus]